MLQGKCLGVTYASGSIFINRSEQTALRCREASSMMEVSKEEQGKPELLITKKKKKRQKLLLGHLVTTVYSGDQLVLSLLRE